MTPPISGVRSVLYEPTTCIRPGPDCGRRGGLKGRFAGTVTAFFEDMKRRGLNDPLLVMPFMPRRTVTRPTAKRERSLKICAPPRCTRPPIWSSAACPER